MSAHNEATGRRLVGPGARYLRLSVPDHMEDFKLNQRYLMCRPVERVMFHVLWEVSELVQLKCVKVWG